MKNKIVIFNAVLVTVMLVVVLLVGVSVNRNSHYDEAEKQIVTITKAYCDNFDISRVESGDYAKNVSDDVRLTVIDKSGKVLYDTSGEVTAPHAERAEVVAAFGGKPEVQVRYSDTLKKDMIYYAETVTQSGQTYCVRVAIPVETVEAYVGKTVPTLLWVLLAALLVSYVASALITSSLVRPIRDVKDMLVAVNNGNYVAVPQTSSDPEVNALVDEINNISQTLQRNMQTIKSSENMRSEFFANASHELKTPLTAVKGFNDLVGMQTDQQSVKELSAKIDVEVTRLVALINDMLALAKLEASAEPVDEQTDLAAVANDVKNSLAPLAEQQGVAVEVVGGGMANVGTEHARTLIKNLTENAIRYNSDGGKVQIEVTADSATGNTSVIVTDNGIGIEEEHQGHVFERFYRVNNSRSRDTGGTGLGLAIVKHIASLYGADITLKSKYGIGTTVKVVFHKKSTIEA